MINMGLDVSIKGLDYGNTYHGGYIRFGEYRINIAKAINKKIGEIYEKQYRNFDYRYSEDDIKEWNKILPDKSPLDIFLWHSDCDGKFTYKECREIYNELKKLEIKDFDYNSKYTMHQLWLNMFEHCWKNRVVMRFY